MKPWTVGIASAAQKQLEAIGDNRVRQRIVQRIDRLQHEPDKQGKALVDELEGYRSVRAVGQRYRIIYTLKEEQVVVIVVTIGIRKDGDKKDAYELAKKLAKLNLLE